MESNLHKANERLKEIRPDYQWDPSPFNDCDDRADAVRCIIDTRLSLADRTIILLYIDCHNYHQLGRLLGFSHMTARKEVLRIKRRILDIYAGKE
jgi:DNA-directed RNA polymerase specialized sigma24 family protein